jgi:hypothetical protein
MITKITLASAFLSTFLGAPFAQGGQISVSPAAMSLRGRAGQATTQTFKVMNLTDSVYEFTVDISDVVVEEGKRVFIPADQSALSLASMSTASLTSFELKPGYEQAVRVTFILPSRTPIRAVAVFFRGLPTPSYEGLRIRLNLGAVVDFSTSNAVDLQLTGPDVTPPTTTSNAAITEQLANVGAEPAIVRGVAVILDGTGKVVGKASFTQKRLLPGESNVLRAEYPGTLSSGRYRVLCSLEYAGRTVTKFTELTVP